MKVMEVIGAILLISITFILGIAAFIARFATAFIMIGLVVSWFGWDKILMFSLDVLNYAGHIFG
jgi:hypothetical protein